MPVSIETVHPVNPLLTNVAIGFKNETYIAPEVFPIVNVKDERGIYYVFGREAFQRVNTKRDIGTKSAGVDYDVDTENYQCEEYALHHAIDDRIRKQAQAPLSPEIEGVELCMNGLLLDYEVRAANLADTPLNYPAANRLDLTAVGANRNWNEANSTPVQDITGGIEQVRAQCAVYPNKIIIPSDIAAVLAWHADIQEIVKYTMPGMLAKDVPNYILPPYLWGMKVVIAKPLFSEVPDINTYADIWDNVLLLYVNDSPALKKPSFGYTIRVSGSMVTRKWREEGEHSDYVEPGFIQDEVITTLNAAGQAIAGYCIWNVLA